MSAQPLLEIASDVPAFQQAVAVWRTFLKLRHLGLVSRKDSPGRLLSEKLNIDAQTREQAKRRAARELALCGVPLPRQSEDSPCHSLAGYKKAA